MGKLKKIKTLSDPYPNLWYELSCYLKAIAALILIILGSFFVFSPLGENFGILSLWFGIIFTLFGLYLFWRIKLVRKLVSLLKP